MNRLGRSNQIRGLRLGWRFGWGLLLAQATIVGGNGLLDLFGQVVPQMPPISHLHRVRSTALAGFGVRAGTIPADHLGARVFTQPSGKRVYLPVRQDIDRLPGVHVDQNRAIAPIASQREVVHAQHRHRANLGIGQATHQAQQRIAADGQTQPSG